MPMTFDPACILFDLDGTLLDTAPDMGRALNQLLLEQGRESLDAATIRPQVSHGTQGLLGLGFGLGPEAPGFEALRERFLTLYRATLAAETRLFPGMEQVLDALESRGMPWGVVTNKPADLAAPLLDELGLGRRSGCLVGGDTVARRKPDPLPLLHACGLVGVEPARCLYVGDAERDMIAGRRAGMATLVAAYGYLGSDDQPESWGADAIIMSPLELLDRLA